MGILALYYLLDAMVSYQQMTLDQMLTIHVDNMAAVRTSNKDIAPGIKSHLTADIDIIQEIQQMKKGANSRGRVGQGSSR
eukprot:11775732-Ditylum_brightwellii.AAC.1